MNESKRLRKEPPIRTVEWLTVYDVAHSLQVSPNTVRSWLRNHKLIGRFFGGRTGYRIRNADLERFINRTNLISQPRWKANGPRQESGNSPPGDG